MSDWRPSASLKALQQRAQLYRDIRAFFAARQVLEVETPILSRAGATDPHLHSFSIDTGVDDCKGASEKSTGEKAASEKVTAETRMLWLQTSPEFAMKRLLAAGTGAIYQISKCFRQGELGSRHRPEFSMLEWYRPGYDEHQLMAELVELLQQTLGSRPVNKLSYRQLFQDHLGFDPHRVSTAELVDIAAQRFDYRQPQHRRDILLDLFLSHEIEPALGRGCYTLIYDYPASQCALTQLGSDAAGTKVARRFELYIEGMELANGYFELTDAVEQRRRFNDDLAQRADLHRSQPMMDELLLDAMETGLPSCAGVALGLDRLLMVSGGYGDIADVVSISDDQG